MPGQVISGAIHVTSVMIGHSNMSVMSIVQVISRFSMWMIQIHRERPLYSTKKYIHLLTGMDAMTVSVTLLQTFNTFSDDVLDLFVILLLGLTWFKVD